MIFIFYPKVQNFFSCTVYIFTVNYLKSCLKSLNSDETPRNKGKVQVIDDKRADHSKVTFLPITYSDKKQRKCRKLLNFNHFKSSSI